MLATTSRSEIGKYGPAVAPKISARPLVAPITTDNAIITITVGALTFPEQIIQLASGITVTFAPVGGITGFAEYGDQSYFWTKEWQADEATVDYEYRVGATYKPKDVDDLIRSLRED